MIQANTHGLNIKSLHRITLLQFNTLVFHLWPLFCFTKELLFKLLFLSQLSLFLTLNFLSSPEKQGCIIGISGSAIKSSYTCREATKTFWANSRSIFHSRNLPEGSLRLPWAQSHRELLWRYSSPFFLTEITHLLMFSFLISSWRFSTLLKTNQVLVSQGSLLLSPPLCSLNTTALLRPLPHHTCSIFSKHPIWAGYSGECWGPHAATRSCTRRRVRFEAQRKQIFRKYMHDCNIAWDTLLLKSNHITVSLTFRFQSSVLLFAKPGNARSGTRSRQNHCLPRLHRLVDKTGT